MRRAGVEWHHSWKRPRGCFHQPMFQLIVGTHVFVHRLRSKLTLEEMVSLGGEIPLFPFSCKQLSNICSWFCAREGDAVRREGRGVWGTLSKLQTFYNREVYTYGTLSLYVTHWTGVHINCYYNYLMQSHLSLTVAPFSHNKTMLTALNKPFSTKIRECHWYANLYGLATGAERADYYCMMMWPNQGVNLYCWAT